MYNVATWPNDSKLGGVTLKAAGLIAADNSATAVYLGKGNYRLVITWTACEVATGDEFYNIVIEGDRRDAAATYYKVGALGCYGAANATGDTVTPESGSFEVGMLNPLDNNVRVRTYVNGTVATGMNFAVVAYPINSKQ